MSEDTCRDYDSLSDNPDPYLGIRNRNKERWGIDRFRIADHLGRENHAGMADLVAELVQNAEDAGAKCLALRVLDEGLLIYNDGRPFHLKDVEAISGLLVSGKEHSAIGYFGIGFKAVLAVTRTPCVLSGRYRFWLRSGLDPYPINSRSDSGEEPPEIPALPEEALRFADRGSLFWLPWREPDTREKSLRELNDVQEQLGEFLLFLHQLQSLDLNGVRHEANRLRLSPGSWEISLRSPDGLKARYLRFGWTVRPSQEVVAQVISHLEPDDPRRKRWEEDPPDGLFGFAFRLGEDGRPEVTEGKVFVYLPTAQASGTSFHIQGRMALTADRKRVKETDPMTLWAYAQLEAKAAEIPNLLREAGMFPAIWHVFPKKGMTEGPWGRVTKSLLKALEEGKFFVAQDGRFYHQGQVRLAHREELYGLLTNQDLAEVAGQKSTQWVHPELRHGRAREVIRSLGVQEIGKEDVFAWLESKDHRWWQSRRKDWLVALYRYLEAIQGDSSADRHAIHAIPLIRLQDGRHVAIREAVLPPEDTESLPETLRSEFGSLPVVDSELASTCGNILRRWGVQDFHVEILLERILANSYQGPPYPSREENKHHVRLLFQLRNEISMKKMSTWGAKWPILLDRAGRQVKPCEAYLPPDLDGLKEMETYLQMAGGRPVVASIYPNRKDDVSDWYSFLTQLGCAASPRSALERRAWPSWSADVRNWCRERGIDTSDTYSGRDLEGGDWKIDGMEEIITKLKEKPPTLEEARALWTIGASLHQSLQAESFISWFYYTQHWRGGRALWVQRLRTIPWLPDEEGKPHLPEELFDPALKGLLPQQGFRYLHSAIPLKDHRTWAEFLGIRMEASVEEVCSALSTRLTQGARPDLNEIRRIYQWLERQCEQKRELVDEVRQRFDTEALIVVPDRGLYTRTQICWADPTGLIPEVSTHWRELRRLFVDFLEIREGPDAEAVAQHVLSSLIQRRDPKEWHPVAVELDRQWSSVPERLRLDLGEVAWPGRRGGELVWKLPGQLCLADDRELANLLEGKLCWWELTGLQRLAERLGVRRISQAKLRMYPIGDRGTAWEHEQTLSRLWETVIWFVEGKSGRSFPPRAPAVRRAHMLQVAYEWDGVESERVDEKAGLDVPNWTLWVVDDADERDIGDALERGISIPDLREFLKDIWEIDSARKWDKVLQWWKKKLSIATAPELPRLQEPIATPVPDHSVTQSYRQKPSAPKESFRKHGMARSSTDREAMEQTGIDEAMRYERQRGWIPKNVSEENLGYDILSKDPQSGDVRYIEVKGYAGLRPVELTDKEYRVATKLRERCWLYVVFYCDAKPDLVAIQDPARLDWEKHLRQVQVTSYRISYKKILGNNIEEVGNNETTKSRSQQIFTGLGTMSSHKDDIYALNSYLSVDPTEIEPVPEITMDIITSEEDEEERDEK